MALFTSHAGTLLGPLTTAWSMPDSCTNFVVNCAECTFGFRGQQCVAGTSSTNAEDHTTCWPPAISRAGTPRHPFIGWGFYSPGLACPTGYTTACTAQHGGRAEWDIQFTLVPGETAVGCCPEGFRCTNRNGNTCIAIISTDTSTAVTTAACSGARMVSVSLATFPDIITVPVTTATEIPGGPIAFGTATREMTLLAPMFQLNFQQSDLSPTTTAPTITPTTTAETTAAATTHTTSSTPVGVVVEGGSDGLSTGATVGVAVGAAIGGLLLGALAIAAWFWRKRRREQAATLVPQEVAGDSQYGGMVYYGAAAPKYAGQPSPPVELPMPPSAVELYSGPMVELPVDHGHPSHNRYE